VRFSNESTIVAEREQERTIVAEIVKVVRRPRPYPRVTLGGSPSDPRFEGRGSDILTRSEGPG
jgi:hypothetical protein